MGYRDPAVPAVYIFGDSTFDVGTNNFLNDTKSKADMPFYGIDYSPSHSKPTGRFSNGYNTADCIVQLLGFKESPPPFLYLVQNDTEDFNTQILKGVNFAGGGAGILHHTGKQRFNLISLGARKFGILGLAPLGSVPDVRGSYGGNSSNEINAVAELFNYGLYYMLLDLNSSKFPEFKFSFGNTYSITTGMINNPASLGLSDVATACCGNQTLTSGTPCSPNATVCEFRHKFLFWDRHHPTEYGSQLAANDLFNGGSEFASPFNLSTLVQTL
ncbi:GDSL esterase/lipase At5g37690-like [Arachis hypogaea]|uniref:GDSL esterase/lipase At5g37690-like n=1 Tax=Arachis hypogaea TaxID=3818 RepID=UPI0010FC4347|nr:GDSL esterase/lipase At5g37690-like [Arachis hypogaea]